MKTNRPEKIFSTGAVQAAVWNNEVEGKDNVSFKTITLTRRYKDKEGTWKSSSSLRSNDLPKASLVLNKAYEYIMLKQVVSEKIEEAPIVEEVEVI